MVHRGDGGDSAVRFGPGPRFRTAHFRLGVATIASVRRNQGRLVGVALDFTRAFVMVHAYRSLTAGLSACLAEELELNGGRRLMGTALQFLCRECRTPAGALAASFGIAGISNLMNNLPAGMLMGDALRSVAAPPHIRNAILIGVDLGPNLRHQFAGNVVLLIALRREGERIGVWEFFKAGIVVMVFPALLLASLAGSLFVMPADSTQTRDPAKSHPSALHRQSNRSLSASQAAQPGDKS